MSTSPPSPPPFALQYIFLQGPASALQTAKIALPTPLAGELLLRVHAAGLNRPDVLQRLFPFLADPTALKRQPIIYLNRKGFYPPPPGAPDTMGLEVAGEVVAVGDGDIKRWKIGDRVCALLGGGGYAEYARVDARHALPIPKGLSMVLFSRFYSCLNLFLRCCVPH